MSTFDLGPRLTTETPDLDINFVVLEHVLAQIKETGQPGWALEFGVATGQTLQLIAGTVPAIGFDSFQGLPEDWREDFPAGFFAGVRPPHPIPNATLVEGWFKDTVPNYDWPEQIALVHLDADLYSSTALVLAELADYLQSGTYLVFDEFFGYEGCEDHEQKAFAEFIEATGFEYDVVGHGREQWAVRLR